MSVATNGDEPLRTRAQWVDRRLRTAILAGELRPGERLRPNELATRLGVSPTPLREALFRLEADGLVESVPHKGTRVTPLTRSSLTQLYELRLLLEPLALGKALDRLAEVDLDAVRASHERLVALEQAPDLLAREEAHRAFHHTLLVGCASPWLLSLTDSFSVHSSRYRLLSLDARGGHAAANLEHESLLTAFLAGDAPRATELLRAHIERTLDLVMFLPEFDE
ncbi:MAG TPA: GntR family transcriptional regulator [Mycobacteriales bacterium]|nr:GntR family transcriptional regulator [Mycobacteriales bacterium]